jgi:hypothetical protein
MSHDAASSDHFTDQHLSLCHAKKQSSCSTHVFQSTGSKFLTGHAPHVLHQPSHLFLNIVTVDKRAAVSGLAEKTRPSASNANMLLSTLG